MKEIPEKIQRETPAYDILSLEEIQVLIKCYEIPSFDRAKSIGENLKESLSTFFKVDSKELMNKLHRIEGTAYETFLYTELEEELKTRKNLNDFLSEKGIS